MIVTKMDGTLKATYQILITAHLLLEGIQLRRKKEAVAHCHGDQSQ